MCYFLETGYELSSTHGLKKTLKEGLTRPVGSATSTFYSFFDFKEALGLELVWQKWPEVEERLRAGYERMIENERNARRGDPEQEVQLWAEKIPECARLRIAYQDQQAAGLMTLSSCGRSSRSPVRGCSSPVCGCSSPVANRTRRCGY
jgi:hypothetical protein